MAFQQKFTEYSKEKNVNDLLGTLLRGLIVNQPNEPIHYLLKELTRLKSVRLTYTRISLVQKHRAEEDQKRREQVALEAKPENIENSGFGDGGQALKKLVVLHFSDACQFQSRSVNPVGGAARLSTLVKRYEERGVKPLLFFTGNTFGPSSCQFMFPK